MGRRRGKEGRKERRGGREGRKEVREGGGGRIECGMERFFLSSTFWL